MAARSAQDIVPPAKGLTGRLVHDLPQSDPSSSGYVGELVTTILQVACEVRASDVHFSPGESELAVQYRIDGVLQQAALIPRRLAPNVVARLKVLAELLTYRTDVPQEGRLRDGTHAVEMRLSVFPTLYGEKAVVRVFAGSHRYQWPSDLGLTKDLERELLALLAETAGALVVTGPAGSGKTTTAYACLRELQRQVGDGKSVVSLEDPIESVLAGISQSQVNRSAGFDYAMGVRSLLRQDPDAIFVGEIRDRETAETVFQACLTGHLVLTTFHAGSAAEAVCRLGDMGVEPYLLRAGLLAIVNQRLFRQLCDCAEWTEDPAAQLGYDVPRARVPRGCSECDQSGYRGRFLLAELLRPGLSGVGRAILSKVDMDDLHSLAVQGGMQSIGRRIRLAISDGLTSPAEARRVLGFRETRESINDMAAR